MPGKQMAYFFFMVNSFYHLLQRVSSL